MSYMINPQEWAQDYSAQLRAWGLGSGSLCPGRCRDTAAYKFVRVNVARLLNADFSMLDNPLTQLVFTIVHEYVSLVPDSMLEAMLKDGAIIAPDSIDNNYVLTAVRYGLTEVIAAVDVDQAAKAISSKGQFFAGKQIGTKVTRALAVILAVKITKKILRSPQVDQTLKRNINRLHKSMKTTNGALVSALVVLLNANGFLGLAAAESRQLHSDCPTLWKTLRFDLGGFDMMLFLIKDFVAEYLDRISILEKNPMVFLNLMAALVKEGKTREIFFPGNGV